MAFLNWHLLRRMATQDVLARLALQAGAPQQDAEAPLFGGDACRHPTGEEGPEANLFRRSSGAFPAPGPAPDAGGSCEAGGRADRLLRLDADLEMPSTTGGAVRNMCRAL